MGIHWDFPQSDAPWQYISKCEILLARFDDAVRWYEIAPDSVYEEIEKLQEDENEADNIVEL